MSDLRELPYFQAGNITLYLGDNRTILPALDVAVSAVVTDPPYGLEFMGKEWDKLTRNAMRPTSAADQEWNDTHTAKNRPGTSSGLARRMRDRPDLGKTGQYAREMQAWHQAWCDAVLAVMLPGAHLLAFGGTRTFHRLAVAIEDAGLEIRDTLTWLYGSGFPKSLDVGKAIDKAAGAEREVLGYDTVKAKQQTGQNGTAALNDRIANDGAITAPATDAARQWDGWGTALKPAYEPIILARKPFPSTVASQVLATGTGALNIGASRVAGPGAGAGRTRHGGGIPGNGTSYELPDSRGEQPAGRWPPNVILDPTAAAILDEQSGLSTSKPGVRRNQNTGWKCSSPPTDIGVTYSDTGGASRFFPVLPVDDPDTQRFLYSSKASRRERNAGLEGMPERRVATMNAMGDDPAGYVDPVSDRFTTTKANHHPTVKPLAVMRWLLTLVTPPGGIVLDPFAGSGTTGVAAAQLGFPCILIEQSEEYCEIAARRIEHALEGSAK